MIKIMTKINNETIECCLLYFKGEMIKIKYKSCNYVAYKSDINHWFLIFLCSRRFAAETMTSLVWIQKRNRTESKWASTWFEFCPDYHTCKKPMCHASTIRGKRLKILPMFEKCSVFYWCYIFKFDLDCDIPHLWSLSVKDYY